MKQVVASMAGTVIQILAAIGDSVEAGQDVVTIESMKMEVPIAADAAGRVSEIRAAIGDFVNEGDVLLVLD